MLKQTSVLAVLLTGTVLMADDQSAGIDEAIHLLSGQTEFLRVEPILVTVRLKSERLHFLPPGLGVSKVGTLRFKVNPKVKPRSGARALPLEAQAPIVNAQSRDYDLLEWYQFPSAGKFTVRAVFQRKGVTLTSKPITFTIRKPGKDDPELSPVARIHHPPWCNYGTNKFCGDTFDLVKRWPDSRLARYCHYWNGQFLQHEKQYDKAIASYRMVVKKYPKLALADDADFGIVECLYAQGKLKEAQKYNTQVRQKYNERAKDSGLKYGDGQTIVQRLAHGMTHRINRDLGLE